MGDLPGGRPIHLSEQQYLRLKELFCEMATKGSFDANDALFEAINAGITINVGDVATALQDLTDLEDLLCDDSGNGPHRYRLP